MDDGYRILHFVGLDACDPPIPRRKIGREWLFRGENVRDALDIDVGCVVDRLKADCHSLIDGTQWITEPGLYLLMFESDSPIATDFVSGFIRGHKGLLRQGMYEFSKGGHLK